MGLNIADVARILDSRELLEILAEQEHNQRWASWHRYATENWKKIHPSGEPYRKRWDRQAATAYVDLTDAEKESDRIESRKVLGAIRMVLNIDTEDYLAGAVLQAASEYVDEEVDTYGAYAELVKAVEAWRESTTRAHETHSSTVEGA